MITENTQDYKLAASYLFLLAGNSTSFTFQVFPDSDNLHNKSGLTRMLHGSLHQHWQALVNLNNRGAGVFVTVNATDLQGRKENNITHIRAFFCDHDDKLPSEYHLKPSFTVLTSANKGHSYWVLSEPEIANKITFQELQNKLISYYSSDQVCKDLPRVLRLPGLLHQKNKDNPYLVTLKEGDFRKYSRQEIEKGLNSLPIQKVFISNPINLVNKPIKNPFKQALNKGLQEFKNASSGTRNSTLNKVAYTLAGIAAGLSNSELLYEIENELSLAATSCGLSESEIKATLKSALSSGYSKALYPFIQANQSKREEGTREGQRSKVDIMVELIEKIDLQWDVLIDDILIEGDPNISPEDIWKRLCLQTGKDLPFEVCRRLLYSEAKQHPLNKVQKYLNNLSINNNPDATLSKLYLAMGVSNELHQLFIRKWFIGAVARAMQHGCQMDYALVLYSKNQGLYKTSFFREMFGEFFQTAGYHKSEVDELLALYTKWCAEHGEIEYAISKQDISRLKAFLTKNEDTFRSPYERRSTIKKRSFVICGTTNQLEFLNDPTGNRRFWVVTIDRKIDIDTIKSLKDEVWAAFLFLYRDKETWFLDPKNDDLAREEAEIHQQDHPWVELINSYLKTHNPCTIGDIMKHLGFDVSRLDDRKAQRQISTILTQLGCKKDRVRATDGTRPYSWHLPK